MKIEHLGIAVKSLQKSDELFAKLLGKENYKQESVEREGVTTSFYQIRRKQNRAFGSHKSRKSNC